MIEEIVRPVSIYHLIPLLIAATLVIVSVILVMKEKIGYNAFIAFIAASIILSTVTFFVPTGFPEWENAVQEQIESLGCEDLQEAYELYEKEYIKEKFLFECVDTREAWYLD